MTTKEIQAIKEFIRRMHSLCHAILVHLQPGEQDEIYESFKAAEQELDSLASDK